MYILLHLSYITPFYKVFFTTGFSEKLFHEETFDSSTHTQILL